ncbi:MAG: tripartite tricarboxylate transporter TctB family protein [Armatimonadota bacterium]|nr:tripartite tricarboxylate transporter TctB family protein [Armatimonadota bacterium]MDR7459963.1 tripartite tricarboxylate transporter TctB family protein [Armatimonadota bacterium]MDR7479591.1 tripartite tricarboxylate transporter TctB family protein [Armatimonadota bacterium]MDR7490564.1 tripartite tricarboxylate transporter TctB family protein [Armatimonadota bacterium]MDR7526546.1 tripartite tricarboxylate transporter TctB family protein [Armatimonadota bacterium]
MGNLLLAAFFLLLGAVFFTQSLQLGYRATFGVGPGFLPLWLSLGMGVGSLAIILSSVRDLTPPLVRVPHAPRTVLIAVAASLGAVLVLDRLGFAVTAWLYLMTLLVLAGGVRPLRAAAVACAAVLTILVVFARLLGVALPAGPLSGR